MTPKKYVHVDSVNVLQLAAEPGAGSDIQCTNVAHHPIGREHIVVDVVVGHVPVGLRGLDLHREHQMGEAVQIGVSGAQAIEVGPVVGVGRLRMNSTGEYNMWGAVMNSPPH